MRAMVKSSFDALATQGRVVAMIGDMGREPIA